MSLFASAARKRRGAPGRVLRSERAKARKESRAIAAEIKQTLSSGHGDISGEIQRLRATLRELHSAIGSSGGGSAHHVAAALKSLDQSLAKLQTASHTTNLNDALTILAEGKNALDQARRSAKAAGSDWSL